MVKFGHNAEIRLQFRNQVTMAKLGHNDEMFHNDNIMVQ